MLVEVDGTVNVKGDVGVSGNVGIQKTATVVAGAGDLRYCNHCKTNINAEKVNDPLAMCCYFVGMIVLFVGIFNYKMMIYWFGGAFALMIIGFIIQSMRKYRCPFCGGRGSGKSGSPISPPKLIH